MTMLSKLESSINNDDVKKQKGTDIAAYSGWQAFFTYSCCSMLWTN